MKENCTPAGNDHGYYICRSCGKRFYVDYAELWAYKLSMCANNGYIYACSWGCMRKLRKINEQRKLELRKKRSEQYAEKKRKEAMMREHRLEETGQK